MKNLMFFKSGRRAVVLAFAAFVPLAAGQVSAAPASPMASTADTRDSLEVGTIPQARQLPPQTSRGAQGPIRTDSRSQGNSDPSIRDNNPLTVNGLWETLPGNRVSRPGS